MIAAVVDVRGVAEARATLARMSSAWVTVRERGHGVIACDDERNDAVHLSDPMTLEEAARTAHTGAFIAMDAESEGAVLLARGAFGGRPLYTARTQTGSVIACSRMEPLLDGLGRERLELDADRLASLCAGMAHPRIDATPFRGVTRVEPCSAVRLLPGGSKIRARPRMSLTPLDGSVEELSEELWSRVVEAVRRAIGDARSVGVLVGGGVDSSGLLAAAVAIARGASEKEVHAISLDFDALGTDRPYLAALAADLGIVPVRLAPEDAGPHFRTSLVLDAQPYILSSGPIEQLMFRKAKELGVEALLSGVLGDELLAGDLRGFAAEALDGAPLRAARAALRLRVPWDTTPRERLDRFVIRPILKPLVPKRLLALKDPGGDDRMFPWAGARMRRVLAELRESAVEKRAPRTPSDRFERFLRWEIYADVADVRSQMEAATGIVRRDAYADEGILDLVSRVRPTMLSHGDIHRGLYRFALRGRVPEKVRSRLDKCWFEPAFAAAAAAGGGLESLGDLWRPRRLEELGIVDAGLFQESMKPLFASPASSAASNLLWAFASQVVACEEFARTLGRTS